MKFFCTACLAALLLVISPLDAAAQTDDVESRPTVTVTDSDINAGDVVRWTADNVYILDGLVIVEDGAQLYVEAGTVIKAEEGTGADASALVIARGGKIFAEGTPTQPIIFTSVQDNISSADLLTYEDRGLWGGIVILGHATTNNPGDAEGDYKEIEGVNELVPDGDTRAEYGGDNDSDNSGVIRYASIRHTGINIGESDGNEIQGLTLGGVGAGTVLEYIEVYASGDDGVEFFGGTVNLKHFVSVFNSDDAVDWDQGWRGKGQFWFVLQAPDKAGAAAEQDGAGGDEFFKPYAIPRIYNVTYVGAGSDASPESDRGEMLMFRDNTGGFYHNSIFTQFNTGKGGHALQIEDIDNTGSKTEDSRQRFEAGDLGLTHNIWWDFGAGPELGSWVAGSDQGFVTAVLAYLANNGNTAVDPELRAIERGTEGTGTLDPRPASDSPAFTNPRASYPENHYFFSETDYIGAFGRANWLTGWTALDQLGYLHKETDDVESRPTVTVTDGNINAGDNVRWTADNVYVLDGLVIVEDGAELHIDAGTVVKAEEGTGADASALVIARGGKIFAEGTPTQPIIFTSVQDNISSADLLTYEDRGLWGGIVILGHATTNNPGDAEGDYKEIEGVNELVPDGDTRAEYGGDNDSDNSGVIRYASIRHTGINIGESDGNEIQGLTLGGVGAGTVLEYIEVYASGDDGVEFFGGTVNLKHFVSVFNSDDAVDWDQGWRGKGQFWFVLQAPDKAGAAAEQDGAGGDEFFKPYAIPRIYNVTYVGAGSDASPESDRGEMLMFRDNTGGFYHNSIFTQFNTGKGGHALQIEDIDNTGSKTEDSRQRFEAGDLGLTHNIWWDFGAGPELGSWVAGSDQGFVTAVLAYLAANGNVPMDPELRGIERGTEGTGTLDPRPHNRTAAFTLPRAALPSGDHFFSWANYIGAFGKENWLRGWTALDELGYVGNISTSIEQLVAEEIPSEIALEQNYPNPFNPSTVIEFDLDRAQHVTLAVYDLTGRQVAQLINAPKTVGTYRVAFDGSQLASGLYIYQLRTENQVLTRKMMLLK